MKMRGTLLRITAVAALGVAFVVSQAMGQASMANQPAHPAGTEKTLTGVVSDSMCGKTHMAKREDVLGGLSAVSGAGRSKNGFDQD